MFFMQVFLKLKKSEYTSLFLMKSSNQILVLDRPQWFLQKYVDDSEAFVQRSPSDSSEKF